MLNDGIKQTLRVTTRLKSSTMRVMVEGGYEVGAVTSSWMYSFDLDWGREVGVWVVKH